MKEEAKEKDGHHRFSPSKLETYERCPCFEQDPDDPNKPNDAAEAGTRQHLALETGDLTKLQDKWERDHVLEGQMIEQALEQEFPNAKVVKELHVVGPFNHGSSDFNLLDFDAGIAVVLDWKFGAVEVTYVDRNLQLWNYALNVLSMYPEINTVIAMIFQPKVDSVPQRTEITRDMIPEIITRIEKVITNREDPNRKATPDGKACGYCNQKAKCEPWQKTGAIALNEEYGFTLPLNYLTCIDVPADQLAARYQAYAFLEEMGKLGKKGVTTRREDIFAITGEEAPGLTYVSRKGNLSCVDPVEALEAAKGVKMATILKDCVTVKASKLVKAMNEANGMPAEDIANELIERGVFKRGDDIHYVMARGKKKDAAIQQLKEAN